jgi:tripartite-type tricarboxylate transporter receptor subunit TctC
MRLVATLFFSLVMAAAGAQEWPQRPVRFIVPFPPGGATDFAARLLG